MNKDKKIEKAVDKMQGLKEYQVTETRTITYLYNVKATSPEEAEEMVSEQTGEFDGDTSCIDENFDYSVEEL